MELIKLYDPTCDICSMLAGYDEQVAEDEGFSFRKVTLEECAKNPSNIRDYVVPMYVTPNDGNIDIPVYLIATQQGAIQASGVIKTIAELNNLITSWKKWDSSRNASSVRSTEKTAS
jgi:hypothetical protein